MNDNRIEMLTSCKQLREYPKFSDDLVMYMMMLIDKYVCVLYCLIYGEDCMMEVLYAVIPMTY